MSLDSTSRYPISVPPLNANDLIGTFEDRQSLRMALQDAVILTSNIQEIVLAYLFFPLVSRTSFIIKSHGFTIANHVLNEELWHIATLSSSFIESYLNRFNLIRKTSLQDIGNKVGSLETLFIDWNRIQHMKDYLSSFPKIRTLALHGEVPADAVIANKDLETLDIFSVENPETAIANVSPKCTKLRRVIVHESCVSKPWLGTIVNRIAENVLRSAVKGPLAQKTLAFIREKAQQWKWKPCDPDARPFYFEWEPEGSWPFRFELCMDTSSLISDYHTMINQTGQKRKLNAVNEKRRVKRHLDCNLQPLPSTGPTAPAAKNPKDIH